jgi:2-polyprenyl-3-methyl-5-hydroxy-6-metoxy-1,4-benzoquinol methylase
MPSRVGQIPTGAQETQERLYRFPYHLIPSWDGRFFSQVVSLHWGYEYLSYLNFVLDELRTTEFASLLDVGCGDGRFLCEVRLRHPEKRLVGIDCSLRAIQWARGCATDVEWVHGDITKGDVLPVRFDVITLIETLEHIQLDELPAFLDGVYKRLSDNGVLIVTVPTVNVPVNVHHVQHFDLAKLRNLLRGTFVIERVSYLNRNSRALRWFYRTVLHNKAFIVNEKHLMSMLFRVYRKYFLAARAHDGRRMFLLCRRQPREG